VIDEKSQAVDDSNDIFRSLLSGMSRRRFMKRAGLAAAFAVSGLLVRAAPVLACIPGDCNVACIYCNGPCTACSITQICPAPAQGSCPNCIYGCYCSGGCGACGLAFPWVFCCGRDQCTGQCMCSWSGCGGC
jgi:hypothetical protein